MNLTDIDPDAVDTIAVIASWMDGFSTVVANLHREAEAIVVLAEATDPDGQAADKAANVMEHLLAALNAADECAAAISAQQRRGNP